MATEPPPTTADVNHRVPGASTPDASDDDDDGGPAPLTRQMSSSFCASGDDRLQRLMSAYSGGALVTEPIAPYGDDDDDSHVAAEVRPPPPPPSSDAPPPPPPPSSSDAPPPPPPSDAPPPDAQLLHVNGLALECLLGRDWRAYILSRECMRFIVIGEEDDVGRSTLPRNLHSRASMRAEIARLDEEVTKQRRLRDDEYARVISAEGAAGVIPPRYVAYQRSIALIEALSNLAVAVERFSGLARDNSIIDDVDAFRAELRTLVHERLQILARTCGACVELGGPL